MEIIVGCALVAIGLLGLGMGLLAYVNRTPSCNCGVEWEVIDKIGVYSKRLQMNEAIIYVRQCPQCKLIHQQKVM